MVHFYHSMKSVSTNSLVLKNYNFYESGSGSSGEDFIFIAIQILIFQDNYNVDILISSTSFSHMNNSLALYHYSEACKTASKMFFVFLTFIFTTVLQLAQFSHCFPLQFMDVVFNSEIEQHVVGKSHL